VGDLFVLVLVEAELVELALAKFFEGFALGGGGLERGFGPIEGEAGFVQVGGEASGFVGEGLVVAGVGGELERIEGPGAEAGAEVIGGASDLRGEVVKSRLDAGDARLGGGEFALALLLGAKAQLEDGVEGEDEMGH
jgi:hypothetical protein